MNVALELLVILGLALVNAFFSGAEVAILSVRKTRLSELAHEGVAPAQAALRLREAPERFLATVQVGITVVGASAGAFGGAALEGPMARLLAKVGLGAAAEDLAFASVVAFISFLTIVIGELVPKSLALRHSERTALLVARPLELLARVSRPVVWFLTGASNALLRPFNDQTNFTEARLSSEELQALVQESTAASSIDREAGQIASRAIDLGRLAARAVMVLRADITWIDLNAPRERVEAVLRTAPHARYPVHDDTGEPAGYVLAHEIYAQLLDGEFDLPSLLREIPTFSEGAAAVEILRALQSARSEIGLIVDDGGAPSGLVSIEMLAEELFGEIAAENEVLTSVARGTRSPRSADPSPGRRSRRSGSASGPS
jgi:putative hemolysin